MGKKIIVLRFVIGLVVLACVGLAGCRKACKGDGRILRYDLTAPNWEWFIFPEGTRIPYQSNLGGKDTAVFGAVYVTEEKCCHNDKECSTDLFQKINQDITWLHNMDGKISPPIRLSCSGGFYNRLNVFFLDKDESHAAAYDSDSMKHSITANKVLYTDVNGCCSPPSPFYELKYSKSSFFIKISYRLPDNTIETWERR